MITLARCCVCSFYHTHLLVQYCLRPSSKIPDPNLEKAIREALGLPDEIPLTQRNSHKRCYDLRDWRLRRNR